ncbi:alpha/beta fold hydrolase [Mycoplasma sp. 2704]|uniref:alpha/beta fold hydrolase n=1 Tax=unclassified Mycoplasma TaxID=2683645 RepID=UPI002B1E6E77|nr:alpha/beta fold hydrolase [Mycoplasma sp. 2704]MEA4134485.1 alpha/beta fold hydrolase [Mycoplasma sp. 2704]
MIEEKINFTEGYLELDSNTKMWYGIYGNPKNNPILIVHGGPGESSEMFEKEIWNVKKNKYIFFDQRGCGKSTPLLELKNNKTDILVEDIEKLRKHLKLNKLKIYGDGWGTTLTLMYAIKYPQNVAKMFLRSVFLARQEDIDFLFEGKGANWFYPKEYEEFTEAVANFDGKTNIEKYYKALTNRKLDYEYRKKLAINFYKWEFINILAMDYDNLTSVNKFKIKNEEEAYQLALLESYYFYNKSFLPSDNYILENSNKYKHIPTYIAHGHRDLVARYVGAYLLIEKLDNVKTCCNKYILNHSVWFIENMIDTIKYCKRLKK